MLGVRLLSFVAEEWGVQGRPPHRIPSAGNRGGRANVVEREPNKQWLCKRFDTIGEQAHMEELAGLLIESF